MDLSSLKEVINELDLTKVNVNSFDFNDMVKEISEIEYNNNCKNLVVKNIGNWIKNNMNHTFPKKKKGWINLLNNQSELREIRFQIPISTIINHINFYKVIFLMK